MRLLSVLLWLGLVLAPSAMADPLPRMRLEEFVKDAQRVAALKRGVREMKARKPSDPRSWFFQAAVHGVTPEAIEAAKATDPDVASVDQKKFWNQCPHFAELNLASANFVIWHRAYLHYFERILRDASGDPTLSLPYWNYTDELQRGFPVPFADAERDPGTQEPTNPLFDMRRENAFTRGLLELSAAAVSTALAFDQPNLFGAIASDGFAGAVGDVEPGAQGLLERGPHNPLHFAIGGFVAADPGGVDGTAGLMSVVQTAAFDPIFWVHHSNIDRLFHVWDCLPERAWGVFPSKDWFAEKPWAFHDETGAVQSQARGAYLSARKLGIRFDTDRPNCKPLTDTLEERLEARRRAGRVERAPIAARRQDLGTASQALRLSPVAPTVRDVPLTARTVLGAPGLRAALRAPSPGKERRVLLELDGISWDTPPNALYDVFVDLPAGATHDRASTSYVGSLSPFGVHHGHGHTAHDTFDVTRVVQRRHADAQSLKVTLVPVPLLVPRAGAARVAVDTRPRDPGLTVQRFDAVVVELDSPDED